MMSKATEKLAIHGGTPVRTKPYDLGKKHSLSEWKALRPIFERGSIPMTRGPEIMKLREMFCEIFGKKYAVTTSSGTAAIHTALAAVGVGRCDEVITSPSTDMGSLVGILQLNAVPVFADIDPSTRMITAKTVEAAITPRTKAVEVVHIAGMAADTKGIMRVCKPRGIAVIEDCAQSYLCTKGGHVAGTLGDIGCWSMNESKHIGAGDGGIMLTDNAEYARRADLFADKCYSRDGGPHDPFFAPLTYRLNALAAAVTIEQLKKLEAICARRNLLGSRLDTELSKIDSIGIRPLGKGDYCTYWFYIFSIDTERLGVTNAQFSGALKKEGIPSQLPHTMNVLNWSLFKKDTDDRHACSYHCPSYKGGKPGYRTEQYPGMVKACEQGIELLMNQNFSVRDILDMAKGIGKVTNYYMKKAGK